MSAQCDDPRYLGATPLGEGASARVSRALDGWSGREVVIKEAREVGSGGHGFLKEARLLQLLRAPVFPELVEFDPGSGQRPVRLVMDRRPGLPLEELVREGRLLDAPGEAEWVAAQVLQGLAELAEHGWVHGDLGPANLLLDGSRASLLDLGLARSARDRTQARSGTLSVMPPEILRTGLPHPRSDLFSLGALLFQALGGGSPFPDDPEAAVAAILAGQLRPAGRAATHPLFPFVLRCLQTDPARRPDPAEALGELLAGLPANRLALLLPRRGPGLWEAGPLAEAADALAAGRRVDVQTGSAGPWRPQLAQLLVEAAARHTALLAVDRRAGESLLDWLGRRVGDPARLGRYPELAACLERRRCGRDLPRLALGFLDDQLGRPRQGVAWLARGEDPDQAMLAPLADLCQRQGRALLVFHLDQPHPDALRLDPPDHATWSGWLRHPAPGLVLDGRAAQELDPLTAGDSEHIAPLVARFVAEGHLAWRDGRLAASPAGLPALEARGPQDVAALSPARRLALLRACAWLEPSPAGSWRRLVAQGRERELEELQGAGWLRDRGDGQLEPAPGVAALLDPATLAAEHVHLLGEFWNRPEPAAELCLLHLGRGGLPLVDPRLACHVLLAARGLVDPASKVRLIAELLPSLPPGAETDNLEGALTSGLLGLGRLDEARARLRDQLRHGRGEPLPRLNMLAFTCLQAGRPRLALRLLERGRQLSSSAEERVALSANSLEPLMRLGRRTEAARRVGELLEPLLAAEGLAEASQLVHALNATGVAAFQLGQSDNAALLWGRLDRAGRQQLQVQQRINLSNNLGILHLQAGRLEQARGELEHAGREAALYHLERAELMARVNLAHVQLRRGAADQAIRELEPALQQACELLEPATELAVRDLLGEAWAALGDFESAELAWQAELERARELDRPQDELDPLVQRLRLDVDLDLPPDPGRRDRLRELDPAAQSPTASQWRQLEGLLACLGPERGKGGALDPALLAGLSPCLRQMAAGREVDRGKVLDELMEMDPPLDGARLALAMLENRLAWLADWAPRLREERALGRLMHARLLALEGELDSRREAWPQAGQRLGRAVRIVKGIAEDLPPAWRDRLAASPWVGKLLARALECQRHLDELERREHGHAAGPVGRLAGA